MNQIRIILFKGWLAPTEVVRIKKRVEGGEGDAEGREIDVGTEEYYLGGRKKWWGDRG